MVSVQMDAFSFKKMDFTEFCAAAISVHQLEGTDRWEQHARAAYDIFEKEGNRVISVEELARVRIILLIRFEFPMHPVALTGCCSFFEVGSFSCFRFSTHVS